MILVVSEVFPPIRGGSGRWLWELYRRFPRGSVHVATSETDGGVEFDQTHDLPVTRLPLRLPSWGVLSRKGGTAFFSALRALRKLVRQTKPSVLHCGKCLPEGFLAWTLRKWGGPPYWCYAHGEELTLARTSRELAWLTRRVLRGASGLVANSRHTRELLINDWGVHPDAVHVLHPGMNAAAFVPAEPDGAVRAELGWTGRRVVLTVGALQKRKGQDHLIRALPKLLERYPNLLYSIAGEGWERTYLDGIVAELGVGHAVQFRGTPKDDELVKCYQQCDLFALTNRQVGWDFEGFGIVLLEAQACGRPVLAGASGGTAETLDVGRTGFIADCSTPDRVAEAIRDALASPDRLESMGRLARDWVSSRFDWSALVPQAMTMFLVSADAGPSQRRTQNESHDRNGFRSELSNTPSHTYL
jgi:phosphatidyl-myo-inositol dimannoside synthase